MATEDFVSGSLPAVQLIMPYPCFMEAYSTLEDERGRFNRLIDSLNSEIQQAGRNKVSERSPILKNHLQQALVESRTMFNDFENRLFLSVRSLTSRAMLLESNPATLNDSLDNILIDDPTDNLILSMILTHASASPPGHKALLTENRKCFHDNLDARKAISDAGLKYFADPSKCLEWCRSRTDP